MFCKKCGAEIRDSAKFCHKCGTAILKRTEKKKMIRIVSFVTSFVILLGACSGVFIFRDEIFSLFSSYEDVYSEADETLQNKIVCDGFRNADIETRKKIAEDTLNNLEESGTILEGSIVFDESANTFSYNYIDGAEGAVALESLNSEYVGFNYPDSLFYEGDENIVSSVKSTYFGTTDYPYDQKDLKALILEGTGIKSAHDSALELQEAWNQEYLSTDIDNDVTVEKLKTELSDYDFVYILLHGNFQAGTGNTPNIVLEEKASKDLDKQYKEDFSKDKTIFHLTTDETMVYAVHPNFFTKYYYESKNATLELKDKIIFIGSCHGYQNRDLVDAFIACGAKAVIGPSDVARVVYELPIVNDFVYRLLCGDSVEASLDYAKGIYGEDQWEFADYLFIDESEKQQYYNSEIEFKTQFKIANGKDEYFVTLTDDARKSFNDKGYISGCVKDAEQNPVANANIFISMIAHNALSDISAETDENGCFKIECPVGLYKITVEASGYEEYHSNKKINVSVDNETIIDTIELQMFQNKYTESELKEIVLAESGGNIGAWVYEDFDGDGTKEAYAVITNYNNSMTKSDRLEAVYFINQEGDTTRMPGDFWGGSYYGSDAEVFSSGYRHSNEYTTYQGKGFFSFDSGNGGSGWQTLLYSVKDGLPYELDISRTLQGFYEKDDTYYTTENEFLEEGGHEFPEVELIYDSSTQQFSKGDRITSEEDNKISDWKKAYIEVLSNLNYSTGRFTTAYIDEDDIPELIVAYDSSHVAGCEIYTYYDGKVSKLEGYSPRGEFGSSGGILYSPYKNLFNSRYYGMGSNGDELFRINNGNAQLECYLQHNDYFAGVRVIEFKIDGADVTEDEFWDKYNSYEIDSMVSANYDDMIEANSTNISNYFN